MPIYEVRAVRPVIGRDVFVADTGSIMGDVHLGDEASVWFGAVLRGDYMPIRVGARTNIQDNAVVHITAGANGATLGHDVTVGHSAIVHGCTVGNFCLVGMGSIVLDGTNVGDESFIAAGSLVTPNTVIPARSFVMGRPAKVVRPVREEDLAWIRASAQAYMAHARDFRSTCKRLGPLDDA
jgi:gamma-carbonic anhydrase